ncbi:hypothetical protein N7486_008302 [Penicillium sp. IBT 16267x]|nr:hypothetical protein N7486_008302 [Penicillium sp. IBT 16267x]
MPGIKREISHQDVTNVPETRTSRSGRALKAPAMYEPAKAASRKGKRATKKEANITCVKCNRGNSPSNNMIVFCDGCNETWHQKCHDPTIDDHVIQVAAAEWHCHKCEPAQEPAAAPQKGKAPAPPKETAPASKKQKASAPPKETAPASKKVKASAPQRRKPFVHPRIGRAGPPPRFCEGSEYSIDARRAYLSQLAHAELVELAVNVSIENPHVAMFPRDMCNYFNATYAYPTQHHLTGSAESKKRRLEDSEESEEAMNVAKRAKTMPPPATKPAVRPNTRSQSATASVGNGRKCKHKRVLTTTTIPKTLQDRIDERARNEEFCREYGMGSVSLSSTTSGKSEMSEVSHAGIQDHRQYPAAGKGFSMASQPEDLDILQEAEDCPTFSHAYNAATQNISRIREMLSMNSGSNGYRVV